MFVDSYYIESTITTFGRKLFSELKEMSLRKVVSKLTRRASVMNGLSAVLYIFGFKQHYVPLTNLYVFHFECHQPYSFRPVLFDCRLCVVQDFPD